MASSNSAPGQGQMSWAKPVGAPLQPGEKAEIVRELYRKHAACLLAIEDDYRKTTMTVLGIFAAAATLIGALAKVGSGLALGPWAKGGLSIAVVAVVLVGWLNTRRRDTAHRRTRELLVQCETALGLYEKDVYLSGESLYPPQYQAFGTGAEWMGRIYWLVVAAGTGLLVALWGI